MKDPSSYHEDQFWDFGYWIYHEITGMYIEISSTSKKKTPPPKKGGEFDDVQASISNPIKKWCLVKWKIKDCDLLVKMWQTFSSNVLIICSSGRFWHPSDQKIINLDSYDLDPIFNSSLLRMSSLKDLLFLVKHSQTEIDLSSKFTTGLRHDFVGLFPFWQKGKFEALIRPIHFQQEVV